MPSACSGAPAIARSALRCRGPATDSQLRALAVARAIFDDGSLDAIFIALV
jgi:hypothetical protein